MVFMCFIKQHMLPSGKRLQFAVEAMAQSKLFCLPIRMVDLSSVFLICLPEMYPLKMVIFHSYVNVYQRVNLHVPMVFLWFSH